MARIALKIDVDTERGTREGVPRIVALLERLNVKATFLFSLGPDHTGRAIRRVFRRGFVQKAQRTSVLKHYGLRTLLYGTLLPGPHIGRRNRALLRDTAARGFECGVHTYDHTRWQDGVMRANEMWTRREMSAAQSLFADIFGEAALVHGAAGWQLNTYVPDLEYELGFQYASDVRGTAPFMPVVNGLVSEVPQLPTTLPTLDELLGRTDLVGGDAITHLTALTRTTGADQVYTLHAELEGGAYLADFQRLLNAWCDQGHELCDLATQFDSLDRDQLPRHEIALGAVEGRSGLLATQGAVWRG